MIKLENAIIYGDLQDILNTLKSELSLRGLNRFQVFRDGVENIQTNCPFHKNGQERKPSFGINKSTGSAHCFTCGWSGDLTTLISELFGKMDGGTFGRNWLLKRYNSVEVETRPNVLEGFYGRDNFNNRNIHNILGSKQPIQSFDESEKQYRRITEEELDRYRYTHPYMYKRGLTDEIIERFDIGYDRERKEITFPVADLSGTVRFIAGRSVKSKFFRLPKRFDKPVYLGYEFVSGRYKVAYITESFLNCLTCWKYDQPAMAMIGTGNRRQYDILNNLTVREYILAFDPDEAGRKAAERFRKNVHGKIIREVQYQEPDKDINDLQEDFFKLPIIF
jgi:DNA primase|nr:MAG TPA: DNA directed DNA polymerase [Caudoviricetes sp.]